MKIVTPWDVEHLEGRNHEQAYACVTNGQGKVLFGSENADVSTYEIHEDHDEDGSHYFQQGEAVDALTLAAAAPGLLESARALISAAECEGWDRARGTDEPRTGIAELRAAIAKAEGRK